MLQMLSNVMSEWHCQLQSAQYCLCICRIFNCDNYTYNCSFTIQKRLSGFSKTLIQWLFDFVIPVKAWKSVFATALVDDYTLLEITTCKYGLSKKNPHETYNLSGIDVIISFPCECILELNMHFGLHMKAIPWRYESSLNSIITFHKVFGHWSHA